MIPERRQSAWAAKRHTGEHCARAAERPAEGERQMLTVINRDLKSNFHTHTIYCDGSDTPEQMAEAAYDLGFSALGFSGHQWSVPDSYYAMDRDEEDRYFTDIRALREKYRGRMRIYAGIERDYCCDRGDREFDYVIGSVHHVVKDGAYYSVDSSEEILRDGIDKAFGGDAMEFVRAYYRQEADVLTKTGGQIVGHFDLITKFNEHGEFFDESGAEYRDIALSALRDLIGRYERDPGSSSIPDGMPLELRKYLEGGKPIVEINTGAMAREYRSVPYPADFLLEELDRLGVPVLLSSDCHDRRMMTHGFEEVLRMPVMRQA